MLIKEEDRNKIRCELFEYIDNNCLFRCDPNELYSEAADIGTIPTKSPKKSGMKWQFYLRRLTHNPTMLNNVCLLMLEDLFLKMKAGEENIFQFAGLETSSIPIITGLQMTALRFGIKINAFSIRKERKNYGLFNFIDGMPTEAPVILIDDLINSGKSLYKAQDILRYELDLNLSKNAYCIIKFNDKMKQIQINEDIINVFSIFDKNEFSTDYDSTKYWLPKDCDKIKTKRPEYR